MVWQPDAIRELFILCFSLLKTLKKLGFKKPKSKHQCYFNFIYTVIVLFKYFQYFSLNFSEFVMCFCHDDDDDDSIIFQF